MKTIGVIAFLFLWLTTSLYAGEEPDYAVKNISAALLIGADAVIRDLQVQVEVVSPDEIVERKHVVITILNNRAFYLAKLSVPYDRTFRHINSIDGKLFDKNGDEISRFKDKDVAEVVPFASYTRFDDVREKRFEFNYATYPFTVSFDITRKLSQSLFLPGFFPQPNINCAVEHASYEVVYPKDFPLRYKKFYMTEQPVLSQTGDDNKITLTVSNINAIKEMEIPPRDYYKFPHLLIASDKFKLGDHEGEMDTWDSFGKFFNGLNAGRDELSDDIKKTVRALTDTCSSSYSKIAVLYRYLQRSTRYVAVEYGMGGWQSVDARFVCEKKYADCKGLANYMKAMLKEADIPSDLVLINGDENEHIILNKDFPVGYFNHVILCAFAGKDTVWMDCTSEIDPAGYLSNFTSDRDAVLLTPSGGYIVRTPKYAGEQNSLVRLASVHIDTHNEMQAKVKYSCTGNFYGREEITDNKSKNEIEDHFNKKLSISSYKTTEYNVIEGISQKVPFINEDFSVIEGSGNVTTMGKRIFIDPVILPMNIKVPSTDRQRTTDFYLASSFSIVDTETIALDSSYDAESIPKAVSISKPFGSYYCEIVFKDERKIELTRTYEQKEGVYPAGLFNDYCAFTKATALGDYKIVLVKK